VLSNRPQFNQSQFDRSVLGASNFVLERRVNRPSHSVADVLRDCSILAPPNGLALGGAGMLFVDEAPRRTLFPIAPGYESWRATARLLSGRRRLVARLDVEFDLMALGSVVLQLRPLDRHPQRWSARHTRRYFALAHAGADRFEQLLNEHAAVVVITDAPRHEPNALTSRPIDPDAVERPARAPAGSRQRAHSR
jgi:hypothetical protein